mmetsp:Transcript_70043/g.110711  ORF Transcript_70043/g.110711 Transcript_70043/m.110711 type:complete len:180 (+) Transcript_70043:62-601(+)
MAMFLFPCVSLLLSLAAGHPSSMSCDFACMAAYVPGASFGYMGIANIGATSGATCAIATDVPTEGFTGGSSYTITVTSTTALAQKLTCSSGDIGGSTEVNTGSTTTSQSYTWTAPSCDSSSSTSFRALCGAGGSIDEMWYAEEVSVPCTADAAGTAVYANGAKTLFLYSLGTAIYRWLS